MNVLIVCAPAHVCAHACVEGARKSFQPFQARTNPPFHPSAIIPAPFHFGRVKAANHHLHPMGNGEAEALAHPMATQMTGRHRPH